MYEIEWWLELYLRTKEIIENEMQINKENNIYEANNLWIYSFYYNDASQGNTVFLVALIKGKVWAFEYPKPKHEEIKIFTKEIERFLEENKPNK